jgi:glycosyltransferase involved in cell wall biosynthesis
MNTPSPRVSVVIPSYNRGATLGRAIHSVLQQDFRDLELIVADDGSTDQTKSVIAGFQDPRLRYIRRPQRGGAGAARNTGIEHARAPLIAFLDSDDEWLPERLTKTVHALESAAPETELCLCALLRWNGRDVVYSPARDRMGTRKGHFRKDILFHNFALTSTWLVRRSAFTRVGGFDEQLRSLVDWEWLVRYSVAGKVVLLDLPLVVVYQSPDSISAHGPNYARSMQRLIELHGPSLAQQPGALANWHYVRGKTLALSGDIAVGRRELWRAWRLWPADRRALAAWLLSLCGQNFFRKAWRGVRLSKGYDERIA